MSGPYTRRALLRTMGMVVASAAGTAVLAACGGTAATSTSGTTAALSVSVSTAAPTSAQATTSSAAATTSASASATATSTASQTSSAAAAATTAATTTATSTVKPSASATSATSSAEPTPGPGGKGIVQPLLRGDPEEVDAWKQIFTNFTAKNPGVKVDPIYTTGDYDAKTVAFVAAGTPPGLWFPAADTGVKHWAAKGLIQTLDQYIQRDKYDLSGFYEQYLPYMKFEGKTVAMPIDEWPWNVYYNKTLFQKAGLPTPPTDWNDKTWTWEKFLDVAKSLTRPGTPPQWGIGDAAFSGARFSAMMYGGDWFPEDSYTNGWIKQFTGNTPEVIQSYQFLSDMRYKLHVSPTADEQKANGGLTKMFVSGQIGMHITSASFIETLRRQNTGIDWGLAAVPLPADKPRRTLIWADYWCFFNGVKDPDAAWTLLKYMLTPDAQVLYPLQSGSVPSLKSLAPNWIKLRQDSNKVPAEVLQVAIDAIPVSHVSADNFTVNWPDLGQVLETPMGDVLAGKKDAQSAIQSFAAAAQDVIKKTSADAKS